MVRKSVGFKDSYSCPIFPARIITFSTRVQWSWIAAKKHITEVPPRIDIMFSCPAQKRTKETLTFGECPVNEIIRDYIDTQRFSTLLREGLLKLGGLRMKSYIDNIIRDFSLGEPQRTQITAKDGTKYQKSRAVVGSPLFGKWYKIPPGFKNIKEAGYQIIDMPPEELLKIENIYCLDTKK